MRLKTIVHVYMLTVCCELHEMPHTIDLITALPNASHLIAGHEVGSAQ
jgi:hypothetical protein